MVARWRSTTAASPGTAADPPAAATTRWPAPVTTSSATTLSAVLPAASARGPQALLPIMPPRVQRAWVEGAGPNRRPYGAATRTALVQPGVVLDDLQRAAAPYGLRFGPDPSTHARCR